VLHAQEVLRQAAYGHAEELIDRLIGEVGVAGVEVQSTVVQERHPSEVLVELSSDADLLVVGWGGAGSVAWPGAGFGDACGGLACHLPGGRGPSWH
jgi:nucleotide-binding universal stress UspA family protein